MNMTLVVPSAIALALSGTCFGIAVARMVWADEATKASRLEAHYLNLKQSYEKIHETDQKSIALLKQTIELLEQQPRKESR